MGPFEAIERQNEYFKRGILSLKKISYGESDFFFSFLLF
jgi:hypothetical protein